MAAHPPSPKIALSQSALWRNPSLFMHKGKTLFQMAKLGPSRPPHPHAHTDDVESPSADDPDSSAPETSERTVLVAQEPLVARLRSASMARDQTLQDSRQWTLMVALATLSVLICYADRYRGRREDNSSACSICHGMLGRRMSMRIRAPGRTLSENTKTLSRDPDARPDLHVMCRSNISTAIIPMADQFHWGEGTQGIVLSSFFGGYMCTQLLGGVIGTLDSM